jgi:2-dehydro-3-deoxyglucarate aldolase
MDSRGLGVSLQRGNYTKSNFCKKAAKNIKSKENKLIVQIEHINALQELDAIIQTEGVDGTFIGPYDLSGSMGMPGQWDEPEVKNAIKIYEETAKKYKKFIGFHVVPPDYRLVEEKINQGYDFIAFGFDAMFLGTMIRNQLKMIKK